MSKSITIRNVSDKTAAELASRAAATGRSLQEYLRMQLEEMAERPDINSWLAEVRRYKAASGDPGLTVEEILEYRDADRR